MAPPPLWPKACLGEVAGPAAVAGILVDMGIVVSVLEAGTRQAWAYPHVQRASPHRQDGGSGHRAWALASVFKGHRGHAGRSGPALGATSPSSSSSLIPSVCSGLFRSVLVRRAHLVRDTDALPCRASRASRHQAMRIGPACRHQTPRRPISLILR